MKRKSLFVATIIFVIFIMYFFTINKTSSTSNMNISYFLSPIDSFSDLEIWDVQVYDDIIYAIVPSGIIKIEKDLINLFDYSSNPFDLFTVYNNHIFLLKEKSNTINIFEISQDSLIEKNPLILPISDFSYASSIKISDDILYVSLNNTQSHFNNLYGYDLNNNKWYENTIIDNIIEFFPINNNEFIIVTEDFNRTKLSTFKSDSGSILDIGEYNGSVWDISLIGDYVYLGGPNGLSKYSLSDNTQEDLIENIYSDEKYCISKSLLYNEGIIILSGNKHLYNLSSEYNTSAYNLNFSIDPKESNQLLAPPLISSLKSLQDNYLGLKCKLIPVENYNDTIRLELISKSGDFDAFIIPLSEFISLNSESLLELNNYSVVNESLSKTFSGIKRSTSLNNKILCIPKDIYTECFSINIDLCEYLQIPIINSLNWSWDYFIDECYKHRIDLNNDNQPDIYLTNWSGLEIIDYIIPTYLTNIELGFNNLDELKLLLEKVRNAQNNGVLKDFNDENRFISEGDILLKTTMLNQYVSNDQGDFLLFPTLNSENPIYLLNGSVYLPNPHSNNLECTIDVLANSIEPNNYIPQMSSVWFNDPNYYSLYSNNDTSSGVKTVDMKNPSNFELLNKAFTYGYPSYNCIHTLELVDVVKSYLNNLISTDEFINTLNSRL